MFQKTRLRIFAIIVIVATVIITTMLSVIFIANSKDRFERDISLLESYIEYDSAAPEQGMDFLPDRPGKHGVKDDHSKMLHMSTIYAVFYNADGFVDKIDVNSGKFYSEQEILEIANGILATGEEKGTYNKMPFLVKTGMEGTIVTMLDNPMETDNSNSLFQWSLIVGGTGWIIVVALSWFVSQKIVDPLEQNDKKQKQFVSDASHELKTPISVISANAELLASEIGENKWLSNIQYENERMGKLVKQLLLLARAESVQLTKEHLDFSRLVSGGVLPFEGIAFEKGCVLEAEIPEGITVEGNREQLSQLVSILIDNAIEHGDSDKSIDVRLRSVRHSVEFIVVNSGKPIPNQVKEQLFERFYRMDEARTGDTGHYGLGLAIAKAIVVAHNGTIEVNCSDGLVEFKVTLPF